VEQNGATRTELLATRVQIRRAAQGCDLLKDKRTQLLVELRKVADVVLAGGDALERSAAAATRLLALAEAFDGPEAVRSAALAASGDVVLQARTVNIMGVQVPEIERKAVGRPRAARGYALGATGPRIDAVAAAFEAELDQVIEMAAVELRLRRLAQEVGTTTRRVNALEHVLIPRLERRFRAIRMVLEEREREDRFRLKYAKRRRARRMVAADRAGGGDATRA
jgi:V/A-type H+-transporting ATPase subunit D